MVTSLRKVLKQLLPDVIRRRLLLLEESGLKVAYSIRRPILVLKDVLFKGGVFDLEGTAYRFISARVNTITRQTVVAGPFQGLRYPDGAGFIQGSAYCPKLLGTYEKELGPILEETLTANYRRVINIGAGDGYYAVGFATRLLQARVIAFESDLNSQKLLTATAAINVGAERVTVQGFCTPEFLQQSLAPSDSALVVCDIEGGERDLIDPTKVSALRASDILVETHDFIFPGVTELIRARFEGTHRIVEIPARRRELGDWPPDLRLPIWLRMTALWEYRPDGMRWLWMLARKGIGQPRRIPDRL